MLAPPRGESVQLTERINRIQISPTSAVIAEAEKLKAKGVDIADFGPGEPDFPTPDHIKKAGIRAIEQNYTKYTPTGGILPLREAICAWHKRELKSSYEPKECVVNVGGKHSIFNVVSVLVQQGDEVIIPAPYWVSYPDIVKYAGGTPVYVETRPEDGFSVKASVIEKAITPKTRMVILSSPNNPTGGDVPPGEHERGGLQRTRHHHRVNVEDLCHDRLAHWLYACAGSAGASYGEAAEPIDVEPHFHRAARGARSHARFDGFRSRDARRICQAAAPHRGRLARHSRRDLRGAGRRVLRIPQCCGASRERHCRQRARQKHHRTGQAAAR